MFLRAFIAALALLIGGALLWVITAGSDEPSSVQRQRVTSPEEKKAVRIEKRLAEEPNNEGLLVAAVKTWIGAGAERLIKIDTNYQPIPDAVGEDYEASLQAWNEYLKQTGGEASAELAEMAGGTFFQLAEIGSKSPHELTASVAAAVRAEKIVCKHEPSMFTFSDLAIYQYFNDEYAEGDKTSRRAVLDIGKSDRPSVAAQLKGYRERSKVFVSEVKKGFETLEETGEEELETPIRAYAHSAGINGEDPE